MCFDAGASLVDESISGVLNCSPLCCCCVLSERRAKAAADKVLDSPVVLVDGILTGDEGFEVAVSFISAPPVDDELTAAAVVAENKFEG
jgi:hypothetical protein